MYLVTVTSSSTGNMSGPLATAHSNPSTAQERACLTSACGAAPRRSHAPLLVHRERQKARDRAVTALPAGEQATRKQSFQKFLLAVRR